MTYQVELAFFRAMLSRYNLSSYIVTSSEEPILSGAALTLWRLLGMDDETFKKRFSAVWELIQPNMIYKLTDEFSCRYVLLLLPDLEIPTMLAVGPYVVEEITRSWLLDFMERRGIHRQWLPILTEYFRGVPRLSGDEILSAPLNTLGDCLWGPQQYFVEKIIGGVPETWMPLTVEPDPRLQEEILPGIGLVEARYDAENRLIQAVSQGRSQTAALMLNSFSNVALEQRSVEPTRNIKNYAIILNTILRKAAESGGVHPLYIDRVSSEFARRIEGTSAEGFPDLWQEMVHKYCLLVKKHSMDEYSHLVQKVIARVDFDLTANLSLKANAAALNVSASYLSALFKKETGVTITDYVNRKRMEHACYLLSNSNLSVSAVGQRCGIQDDNYFTKIFKKHTGKTPKQFRQDNFRYPRKAMEQPPEEA